MGAVEAPLQIVGGARDAVQETVNLGEPLENALPLGGIQILDAEGNFAPRYLGPSDWQAALEAGGSEVALPDPEIIDRADTVTGGLVHGVAQFLTGFGLAGKLVGRAGSASTSGRLATAAGKGFVADFAAFDGQEERLSDLIQEVPALKNPVNEFLAADPTDGEIEGRLKNSVEGLGLGVATEGFVQGLRYLRASREVRRQVTGAQAQALGEEGLGRARTDLIGDPSAPLITRRRRSAQSVVDDAAAETSATEPGEIGRGLTPLGDGEVFVNFARIDAPEDIERIIQDAADAMQPSIDEARRGVRTHATTRLAAEDLNAWEVLLKRRKGEALNAEQSLALRELWVASADRLKRAAETAYREPSPENLFAFRRDMALHHAIQKEAIGARTETARALNQWRIPAGGGREQMAQLERALTMAGGGAETSRDMAKAVLAASQMGGRGALGRLAEKGLYARNRDAVLEYWVNALLSGPKTHMVNMMSNASVIALSMAEHGAAARLSQLIGTRDGVEIGEAMAQWHGVKTGLREAFKNAAKTFRTGETGFGIRQIEGTAERSISSSAWNMRSGSMQARAVDALGAVVTSPGRALLGEDEFFKTIGYRMALHSHGRRSGKSGRGGSIRVPPRASWRTSWRTRRRS
jgi:hypothetical protein